MNILYAQHIDIDSFNRETPIVDLAEALGMEPAKSGSYYTAHCNECLDEGRKRHLTFYPAKNIYVCHKCKQVQGNNFSLIKYCLGTDNKGAVDWIRMRYGSRYTKPAGFRPSVPKPQLQAVPFNPVSGRTQTQFRIYQDLYYLLDLHPKVNWYMTYTRAIEKTILERFGVRSIYRNHKTIESQLQKRYEMNDLIEAGIYYRNKGNKPEFRFWDDCVIFPHFYRGNIIALSSRNLTPDKPKSFKIYGKAYFNLEALSKHNIIYVYEGVINGLSYYSLTGEDNFIATLGMISDHDCKSLMAANEKIDFRFCYDPDSHGQSKNAAFNADTELYNKLFMKFGFQDVPSQSSGSGNVRCWDLNDLLVYLRDLYEEKASFLEYCQGLHKEQAEAYAMDEIKSLHSK